MVAYSYEAKQALLGVRAETLEIHGAVSRETVVEMVSGALVNSGATVAVAVTGIAGPGGGSDDNGTSYIDRAGEPDANVERFLSRRETAEFVEHLPTRERVIIIMRYYLDMSQEAVGQRLGISQMHVSRLQHRALQRLRQIVEGQ